MGDNALRLLVDASLARRRGAEAIARRQRARLAMQDKSQDRSKEGYDADR